VTGSAAWTFGAFLLMQPREGKEEVSLLQKSIDGASLMFCPSVYEAAK
jgi:hypothetical protein